MKPKTARIKQRFEVSEYTNRNGTLSHRVYGIKRSGEMVRKNYADRNEAEQLCAELNAEYVSKTGTSDLRKTTLDPEQIKFCEAAMLKLEKSGDLLTAVDFWLRHGRPDSIKDSPRLDDAFEQFKKWMDKTNSIRHHTKLTRSGELVHFVQHAGDVRIVDLTVDHVTKYLDSLDVKPDSKDAKRKIISSFFRWCMEPERRWCHQNPCLSLKIEGVSKAGEKEPQVFSVEACEKLLRSAETYRGGEMVPTIALCMFAGVRPAECARLDWEQVNFDDSELTITAKQSKTGRKRTIFLDEPLKLWLQTFKSEGFITPGNAVLKLRTIKELAGVKWINDGMRHTAISHFFRKTGSYGLTAERHGNSEAIIKAHYQGAVTSEQTKAFYAITPTVKTGQKIITLKQEAA